MSFIEAIALVGWILTAVFSFAAFLIHAEVRCLRDNRDEWRREYERVSHELGQLRNKVRGLLE